MNLLADGLVLLVLGQTVVFLFLGLMVLSIRVSAALIRRLTPPPTHTPPSPTSPPKNEDDATEITAAIAMALHRYRSRLVSSQTPNPPGV